MKILVTGATGFIGRYVVEQLLGTNHNVIATSIEPEIAIKHSALTYIPCDLNERIENCYEYFLKPDLVIHISWQGLPNYQELFHIEKNLVSNYYFIKSLVSNGCKNIACIGTCFEYGMQYGCLHEDMEAKPNTMYGLAKDTLRKFCEGLKKQYQFEFKWLRLFYPYGKGQSPKSLLSQLDRAISNGDKIFNMSGGEQLRDYLPVETVADYITKVSLQNHVCGIINICSGQPISVRKFVEQYVAGKQAKIDLNLGYYPYPDYEPLAFWGSTDKLSKVLQIE